MYTKLGCYFKSGWVSRIEALLLGFFSVLDDRNHSIVCYPGTAVECPRAHIGDLEPKGAGGNRPGGSRLGWGQEGAQAWEGRDPHSRSAPPSAGVTLGRFINLGEFQFLYLNNGA